MSKRGPRLRSSWTRAHPRDAVVPGDVARRREVAMEEILYLAFGAVAGAVISPKIRPVLLGITTAGYKVADSVAAVTAEQRKAIGGHLAEWRKEWDGFLAEARERAHPKAMKQASAKA